VHENARSAPIVGLRAEEGEDFFGGPGVAAPDFADGGVGADEGGAERVVEGDAVALGEDGEAAGEGGDLLVGAGGEVPDGRLGADGLAVRGEQRWAIELGIERDAEKSQRGFTGGGAAWPTTTKRSARN
jgi:hypothetical protein